PWLIVSALFHSLSLGVPGALTEHPAFPLASLLATAVLSGMGIAFTRSAQLWWTEQNGGTLAGWLISQQEPAAVATTAAGSALVRAAALALPATLVLIGILLVLGPPEALGALGLAGLTAAALLGTVAVTMAAALGTASFFLVLAMQGGPGRRGDTARKWIPR